MSLVQALAVCPEPGLPSHLFSVLPQLCHAHSQLLQYMERYG